jgi:ketosteroid isomerase-like protein
MLGKARHPRALIALCAFAVVAVAAVAVFESSGSFFVPATDPVAQINGDFYSHLQAMHSMNVTSIVQAYAGNATVRFDVQGPGQPGTGNYTGAKKIGNLFGGSIFQEFAVPNFTALNSTVKVTGKMATLDSTFTMSGYNADGNPQNAKVSAHDVYVRYSNDWLISYEVWTFTFPVAHVA